MGHSVPIAGRSRCTLYESDKFCEGEAMHARELVELAAVVSAYGPGLIHSRSQLSPTALEQYWTASKCRLDRWQRGIKWFSDRHTAGSSAGRITPRGNFRGVLEEILTGEILTRVWTAVLCAFDRYHNDDQAEPIARSVLVGHLEARRRVLTLLTSGTGFSPQEAFEIDCLRRKSERWTDLLLGPLCTVTDVSQWAIDPSRAKDFAATFQQRRSGAAGDGRWAVLIASLRSAFGQSLSLVAPNADLNQQLAASILACFPPELLDSNSLFSSVWLLRLANAADDAQLLVEQLLTLEGAAATNGDPVVRSYIARRPPGQP